MKEPTPMRYDIVRTVSCRARPWFAALAVAPIVVAGGVPGALAQTAPAAPAVVTPAPAAPAAAAPAAPAAPPMLPADAWTSTIKFNLQIEGGVVVDTNSPSNGVNFGQLYTDGSNTFQLNQALVTVQRPTDPKVPYDVGFIVQGMYGTDARYLHYVGVLDQSTNMRYQPALIQANVQMHTPWFFDGGVDLKAGMYVSPVGAESIDPSLNPFYSHSYIYNFGIPSLATGAMAIAHVNDMIDVYLDVDTGVNTTLGPYTGDNNSSVAGLAGLNLTLLGGNLTILTLTHIGPENPGRTVPEANRYYRYIADSVITWKTTPKLTLTTELDYIHDDNPNVGRPTAWGIAQYASYALTDELTLNGRAEFFDDKNGFFVGAFPGNQDFAIVQAGYLQPNSSYGTGQGTDYGEITLGVTYKPTGLPAPIAGLLIRPEVRYDRTLDGVKAFNSPGITGGGKANGVFTLAADFVLQF
jgi:hypothetical protein